MTDTKVLDKVVVITDRDDAQWLAGLLIDLEADEPARLNWRRPLGGRLHGGGTFGRQRLSESRRLRGQRDHGNTTAASQPSSDEPMFPPGAGSGASDGAA